LYFLIGIPALLQSEFSLTSAGTKIPGQVTISSALSGTLGSLAGALHYSLCGTKPAA
jgi:hypothetical protein